MILDSLEALRDKTTANGTCKTYVKDSACESAATLQQPAAAAGARADFPGQSIL